MYTVLHLIRCAIMTFSRQLCHCWRWRRDPEKGYITVSESLLLLEPKLFASRVYKHNSVPWRRVCTACFFWWILDARYSRRNLVAWVTSHASKHFIFQTFSCEIYIRDETRKNILVVLSRNWVWSSSRWCNVVDAVQFHGRSGQVVYHQPCAQWSGRIILNDLSSTLSCSK